VNVALPVATAEGFGGIADFPDRFAIKCVCDCCAITEELTPAEATNKVIATVARATTDSLIFIEATTNDEYLSFTQEEILGISILQVQYFHHKVSDFTEPASLHRDLPRV
jgi:hypothetical protein